MGRQSRLASAPSTTVVALTSFESVGSRSPSRTSPSSRFGTAGTMRSSTGVPLMLARSRPCGPGRSGPARCFAGYPLRDARSCLPALGPAGRAARAPLAAPRDTRCATLAHACPLSALRAGPLGPRSLLRGIPAARRSLMLARSRPGGPGRSGPARRFAGYPLRDARSCLPPVAVPRVAVDADELVALVERLDVEAPEPPDPELRRLLLTDRAQDLVRPQDVAGPDRLVEDHRVVGDDRLGQAEPLLEVEVHLQRQALLVAPRCPVVHPEPHRQHRRR